MIEAVNCQDAIFRLKLIMKNARVEDTSFGNSENRLARALTVHGLTMRIKNHDDRDKIIKNPDTFAFLREEFDERVSHQPVNPGEAYKKDSNRKRWERYLGKDGRFSYTYPERMHFQTMAIKGLWKSDIHTRQAYLAIWDPNRDVPRLEKERVPCTIGYHFKRSHGRPVLLTIMRSWELDYCIPNDIWLSSKLAEYVFETMNCDLEFFSSVTQQFV